MDFAPDLLRPGRVYRYHRKEYERMAELGLFRDKRVELLYGVVVTMSPQGTEHAHALRKLTMILGPALAGRAQVQVQLPLAMTDDSEPEPDVSVVPLGDYLDEQPHEAYLVIEVANDSLDDDRLIKGRLYAQAGVAEYWLVDLRRRRVERYLDPRDGTYTRMTTHERGETLHPVAFPDVGVQVGEILPR